MAEVVLSQEKPKASSIEEKSPEESNPNNEYDYSEPPRSTIISLASEPTLKSLSSDTLDPSLIQSEYPRLTTQTKYDYQDPPRDTIIQPDPIVQEPKLHSQESQQTTNKVELKGFVIEDNTELSFKERMKAKKIPEQLNIHSFILMLIGSQNLFLLGTLVSVKIAVDLNITTFQEYFLTSWWAPVTALVLYTAVYIALWRFQRRISISASSFFLIQVAIACESEFLIYTNLVIGIEMGYLFCASFQIISCVYVAALAAQCMKQSYTGIVGRLIAMGPSLVCMALYIAFAEGTWNIVAYVIISFFVSLYVWFLITKIDEFVEELAGRDTMLAGIFCSLLVIKKKIEWVLRIVVFPYTLYLLSIGEKPVKKNPEIIEPLLEQQAKVN